MKTPDEARIRAKQHKLFYMPSYEADVGAIRTVGAAGNGFLFALRDLITTRGTDRAIRLSKMRFFLKLCQKYKAKIVVASLASSPHELRDSHELIAICGLLGLNPEQAKAAFEQVEVMLNKK